MSYVIGHNSFTSQYLLNIYIYCRICRLCIINYENKKIIARQRLRKHFHVAKITRNSRRIVGRVSVSRERCSTAKKIVGVAVFCTVRVVSNESRRLVLARMFCNVLWP
jgi:hypothetical protein